MRAARVTARKRSGRRGARAPRRVVKVPEDRRAEILDAAQALFLEHGYEATSVQQIIDRVGISKGAFYHHFESKEVLLDRLVGRMASAGAEHVQAAAAQVAGSALDRLAACYRAAWWYKKEHLAAGLEAMRILYLPDNLHLRTRVVQATHAGALPVMVGIIRQGMDEGVFDCVDARWTAELILQLGALVNDLMAEELFGGPRADRERVSRLQQRLAFYTEAVERLLGAPRGRIQIVDPDAVPLIVAAAARRRGRASRVSGPGGAS